jgi:cobalt/nickel transport system permease protein
MHIPDGFIDTKTAITTGVLSLAGLSMALRQVKRYLPQRNVPLMGLAAAFVFAAQMLNFPVAAGTSGHLMGAVLVAVLLGPSAAVIVMSSVLIVQCLLFADGGVLALGANIFNMAIAAPILGYGVYLLVHRLIGGERGRITAVAFAGWCSTVIASICCAGELAWSNTVAWNAGFPAMTNIHMLIGLGEGLVTALVFVAIGKTRPELLLEKNEGGITQTSGGVLVYGLLLALGVTIFIAPFASAWPDGLDKVASVLGFEQKSVSQQIAGSPLPEYTVPGIGSATTATAIAGVVGVIVVFGLSFVLARILVPTINKEKLKIKN